MKSPVEICWFESGDTSFINFLDSRILLWVGALWDGLRVISICGYWTLNFEDTCFHFFITSTCALCRFPLSHIRHRVLNSSKRPLNASTCTLGLYWEYQPIMFSISFVLWYDLHLMLCITSIQDSVPSVAIFASDCH